MDNTMMMAREEWLQIKNKRMLKDLYTVLIGLRVMWTALVILIICLLVVPFKPDIAKSKTNVIAFGCCLLAIAVLAGALVRVQTRCINTYLEIIHYEAMQQA